MLKWRVDDFPGTKPEEFYRHNLKSFFRFDAVMKKHQIYDYCLGVIPLHTTNNHLVELAAMEVNCALHGIEHDERFANEFREYETEIDITIKIKSACRRFVDHNIELEGYIPPHNVIDTKTIYSLKKNDIFDIFTGPGTSSEMIRFIRLEHLNLHHSIDRLSYGRSDELIESGAIKFLQKMAEDVDIHLVTLHLPWETNIGLSNLDRFLCEVTGV